MMRLDDDLVDIILMTLWTMAVGFGLIGFSYFIFHVSKRNDIHTIIELFLALIFSFGCVYFVYLCRRCVILYRAYKSKDQA